MLRRGGEEREGRERDEMRGCEKTVQVGDSSSVLCFIPFFFRLLFLPLLKSSAPFPPLSIFRILHFRLYFFLFLVAFSSWFPVFLFYFFILLVWVFTYTTNLLQTMNPLVQVRIPVSEVGA